MTKFTAESYCSYCIV